MNTGPTPAVNIVAGPDDHGVVEHAMTVAAATGSDVHRTPAGRAHSCVPRHVAEAAVAHLHFTDRLYGPDAAAAARGFSELAARLHGRIVVTLHDVPDPDGSDHWMRRVDAYRRVADRADVLIVASAHERERLRRCGIDGDVHAVPLPIHLLDRGERRERLEASGLVIGVLGFIYPVKGHADVIDAAARASTDIAVWAIGRPSDGHDDLAAELERHAAAAACHFVITGFVGDDELADVLAGIDVPVVPARRPSAAASLSRWIGAGRRPLVAANPYTCELASAAPDLLTLYDAQRPESLEQAVTAAADDPSSTWHAGIVPHRFTLAGVAWAHRQLYDDVGARP